MELQAATRAATHFDRTVAVHAQDVLASKGAGTDAAESRSFAAELDETWASLRGVHGGYVTAVAVQAVQQVVPHRSVRTVSASFLRPARPGRVEVRVSILRAGQSLVTATTELRQDDRGVAVARVMLRDSV